MATQETIKQIVQGGVPRDIEDVTARTLVQSLQNALDTLTNGDTTSAIESFNEIISFLENVEDSSTLQGIIAGLSTSIASKVDKVTGKGLSTNDFTTELMNKLIGIAAGATANQGTVTGIKVNNGDTQEPINGVVNLEVETGGEDGVGVASVTQVSSSNLSGGDNVIKVTLTNGQEFSFIIKNGLQGAQGDSGYTGAANELRIANDLDDNDPTAGISAACAHDLKVQAFVESGTFAQAYAKGNTNNVVFPWLLKDTDSKGNNITKMIWHIGDKRFVDAIGAVVNGYKKGFIVTATNNGTMRMYKNENTYKDLDLYVGENTFDFDDLLIDNNDSYSDPTAPRREKVIFGVYETAGDSSTFAQDDTIVTDVDFGGLALNGYELFMNNTTLKTIKNISVYSTLSSFCKGCSSLSYIKVSGGTSTNRLYYNNNTFGSCSKLTRIDGKGLYPSNIKLWTSASSQFKTIDFRDANFSLTNQAIGQGTGQGIETFIIGNLDLSVDASSWFENGAVVTNLIYMNDTPPTLNSGGVNETWLNSNRVTNIYVPADAVQDYKTAWSGVASSKIKGYTEVDGELVLGE